MVEMLFSTSLVAVVGAGEQVCVCARVRICFDFFVMVSSH